METQTEWLDEHPWLKDDDDSDMDREIRFSLDEIRFA